MFTQCPECQTVHKVKVRQLRNQRGILRCKVCAAQFDALQSLSETTPKKKSSQVPATEALPLFGEAAPDRRRWPLVLGCLLCTLALAGQWLYFERQRLQQDARWRPYLERACGALGCQLATYRNPAEWDIPHSSLLLDFNHNYRLRASLSNRARFAQNFPPLRLSLTGSDGDTFAARVFTPAEYLPETTPGLLNPGEAVEIALDIADPLVPVDGFILEPI